MARKAGFLMNNYDYDTAHKLYTIEEFREAGDGEYTQVEVDDYDKAFKRIYGKSFMDRIEDELERIFDTNSSAIPEPVVDMKDLDDATKFLQVLHTGEDSIYQLVSLPIKQPINPQTGERWSGLYGGSFKGNHKVAAEIQIGAYGDNTKKMYVSVNPLMPKEGLRYGWHAMGTRASDKDIACRRWLYVDFDVKYPKGVKEQPATEYEKDWALSIAKRAVDYLAANGISEIMWGCSGNGGTAFIPIDLPNDTDAYCLINDFLDMLGQKYNTAQYKCEGKTEDEIKIINNKTRIEVDQQCKDACRISPMFPTVGKKGQHTKERPYRRSYLVYMPSVESLTPELRNNNTQAIRGLVEAYRAIKPKRIEPVNKAREPRETSTPIAVDVDAISMEQRYNWSLAYLDAIPPAIALQGGNNQTFNAAKSMAIYWDLDHSYTLKCLERYNERCQPPWEEYKLEVFARSAMKEKDKPHWQPKIGKCLEGRIGTEALITELGDIDFGYELSIKSEPNSPKSNTVGEPGAHQPEPIEAKTDTKRWIPYPIQWIPKPLADYAQALSTETGFDIGGIISIMLAISAGLIGKSRSFRVKPGWLEPCALWTCVVADSGAGKSVVLRALAAYADYQDVIMRELKEAQEKIEAERAMRSKRKKDHDDNADTQDSIQVYNTKPMPVLMTGDATWEKEVMLIKDSPNGILKSNHEMGAWFTETTKNNNDTGPYYCQLYDGETVRQDRMGRGCHIIKNALLSIAAMIQPEILGKQATEDKWSQGLMPRFMVVSPPEKYNLYAESEIEVKGTKDWETLCHKLFELRDSGYPVEISISRVAESDGRSAHDLFVEDYNNRQQRKASRSGAFKAITSKAQSWVVRIAGILSLWSQILTPKYRGNVIATDGDIDCACMRAAIALGLWHEREAIRSASKNIEALKQQNSGSLAQWLASHPGCTARQLHRLWSSAYPDTDKAELALNALVKEGKAESKVDKYRGGQTIKYYPI